MDKMKFTPYESLGKIKFGENRDSVRNNYPNFKEFKKNRYSKNTTDDYTDFHVFYNTENKVEAVEVFNNVEVDFKGENIVAMTFSKLTVVLNDSIQSKEDNNINFPTFGMSVFTNGDRIESFLFYIKGYWD
ncbi:MAG: hypothetical protein ACRCZY_11605 [Phocaeicola sp.]